MADAYQSTAPHRGTTILVLGILALVCCQPLGIAAWVMGNADLQAIDQGRMDPTGRDMTNIGRICGMIAVALLVLGTLAYGVILALGMGGAILSSN